MPTGTPENYNVLDNFNIKNLAASTVVLVDPIRRLAVVTSPGNQREVVPFAGSAGLEGEGTFSSPPSGKGWQAVIRRDRGKAYIEHFISPGSFFVANEQLVGSMESAGTKQDTYDSITETTKTYPVYAVDETKFRKNYRGNRFYDGISGDDGFRGPEGNWQGVLRGGVNVSSVSSLNKILQFLEDDLLRIVSRNFEHFTDWGVFKVESIHGETLLTIKGNSGQNNDFKTWEETYEFELQIGACKKIKDKEYFIVMQYNTKDNRKLTLTVDRMGSVAIFGPRDCWMDFTEDFGVTVGQNFGLFAGKSVTMDGGDEVDISCGDTVTENPDEARITVNKTGERVNISKTAVKVGKINSPNMKNLVQAPHLPDKFNPLTQKVGIGFILLQGIFGLPTSGVEILQLMDNTNKTGDTFAS